MIVFSYSNLCQFWTVLDCSEQPRPGRLKTMLTSQCGKTASSKATWNLLGSSSVNYVPHCSSLCSVQLLQAFLYSCICVSHTCFSSRFYYLLFMSEVYLATAAFHPNSSNSDRGPAATSQALAPAASSWQRKNPRKAPAAR